jgi:hypothetical protein
MLFDERANGIGVLSRVGYQQLLHFHPLPRQFGEWGVPLILIMRHVFPAIAA